MMTANSALMVVYDHLDPIGEMEDHARERVRAFVRTGPDRRPLGTHPDRRTAMRAVSDAVTADAASAHDRPD